MNDQELRLIKEAIADLNDVISGIDGIKEGLGLRGQSRIDDSIEAAKEKLRRVLLMEIGEL